MKINNLKKLNREQIENKSKDLLLYFDIDYFSKYVATPLIPITEFLNAKHEIIFKFDTTLGFNNFNYRVLGAFNPKKRIIIIDQFLKTDIQKFNFTLAHELGHLALHRNVIVKYDTNEEVTITETIQESNNSKGEKSDAEWMEWQANTYAAALLMPLQILQIWLIKVQSSMGISMPEKIYVDNQPSNINKYLTVINKLSQIFNVSRTAVEYRLLKLQLVIDKRNSFKKLSDFL